MVQTMADKADDRSPAATVAHILVFSLLVNVVGWMGSFLGGDPSSPGVGFLIWGTAPVTVALTMRAITQDWSDFGVRPNFSRHRFWYLISLLVFPLAFGVALVLGTVSSASSIANASWPAFFSAAGPAAVIFFFFAIFEEVGWRGYLAPKLYSLDVNVFASHAVVALVWASWHLPFIEAFAGHTTESLVTFVPRFFLGTFAFSIALGEIRIITATFWPAVVMHWVGNSIANPLVSEVLVLAPGREYLGSVGADGLFVMGSIGLVGVATHRWRPTRSAS